MITSMKSWDPCLRLRPASNACPANGVGKGKGRERGGASVKIKTGFWLCSRLKIKTVCTFETCIQMFKRQSVLLTVCTFETQNLSVKINSGSRPDLGPASRAPHGPGITPLGRDRLGSERGQRPGGRRPVPDDRGLRATHVRERLVTRPRGQRRGLWAVE